MAPAFTSRRGAVFTRLSCCSRRSRWVPLPPTVPAFPVGRTCWLRAPEGVLVGITASGECPPRRGARACGSLATAGPTLVARLHAHAQPPSRRRRDHRVGREQEIDGRYKIRRHVQRVSRVLAFHPRLRLGASAGSLPKRHGNKFASAGKNSQSPHATVSRFFRLPACASSPWMLAATADGAAVQDVYDRLAAASGTSMSKVQLIYYCGLEQHDKHHGNSVLIATENRVLVYAANAFSYAPTLPSPGPTWVPWSRTGGVR